MGRAPTLMAVFVGSALLAGLATAQVREPREGMRDPTDPAASNHDDDGPAEPEAPAPGQPDPAPVKPSPYAVGGVNIDDIVSRLTLEQKVGQLLFLGFGGTVMDETISGFLEDKMPGGVALFGRNLKGVRQTLVLIREVRAYDPAGVPMFVSVDQEGGNVVRLKRDTTVLPSNMALGATRDTDLAFRAGAELGKDLKLLGFNMNLAPVLDVNSNPKNPVIGIRSFGESPELVGEMGVAYVQGLQSEGVAAVAKHFPGHGDTESDSHHALPVLAHTKERLMKVELVPFARVLAEGLDALMTAHISLPAIAEEPDMPATVSKNVLGGILRDEFGYDGLVMTDGLEMAGIVDTYGSGEAAVRAVEAGADMVMVLWFPEKKNEVQRMLLEAVKSGRIPQARLDHSVRRILATKARRGLFQSELLSVADAQKALRASKTRDVIVDEVATRAITLVKNEADVLPLLSPDRPPRKVVVASSEPVFSRALKAKLSGARVVPLKPSPTRLQTERAAGQIVRLGRAADVVVIGILDGGNERLVAKVKRALPQTPVVVVSFGSPYLLGAFPDIEGYLCAYGFRKESEAAAAKVVLGEVKPTGRLPVSLPTGQVFGHGLAYAGAGEPDDSTAVAHVDDAAPAHLAEEPR